MESETAESIQLRALRRKVGAKFYSQAEFDKAIAAFKERYKVPECELIPYAPEPTYIILSGEEIK